MKKTFDLNNIALSLFVIILISSNLNYVSLTNSTNKNKTNLRSVFSYYKSYSKNNLRSKKTNPGEVLHKTAPTLFNLGLKCLKMESQAVHARYCSMNGQNCTSEGVVIYGPDKDGNYKFTIADVGEKVLCRPETFGGDEFDKITHEKCHSHIVEKVKAYGNNKTIEKNIYTHRVCYKGNGNDVKYILVKQNTDPKCDKKTFGNKSKKSANSECKCVPLVLPQNEWLEPTFIPIRISDQKFQCYNDDGKCATYSKESDCTDLFKKPLAWKVLLDIKDKTIKNYARTFYFDRFLCPSETGLDIAVQYKKTKDRFEMICITQRDDDCLHGLNAESACQRLRECNDAEAEFKTFKCASEAYKKSFGNDGFSKTPVSNWCKTSLAWIKFNMEMKMTENKKAGIVQLGNGLSACIPNHLKKNKVCLEEDDEQKMLSKMMSIYAKETSRFNFLLECESLVDEFDDEPDHWCNFSQILPNASGSFFIGSLD